MVKKGISLLLLLFCSFNAFVLKGQISDDKDSLESLLPFANDLQRADILIGLSNYNKTLDTVKAGNYARQALAISEKLNYCKGNANSLIMLGILEKGRGKIEEAKIYYLKGLSLGKKCKEPYAVSLAYHSLGNLANIKGDFPTAMRYYIGSLQLSEQLKDYPRAAKTYNNIGTLYLELKNYDKSEEYFLKAYDYFKNIEDKLFSAEIATNLATIYQLKGFHLKALYYYSSALEVFRVRSSAYDISSVLNNIGLVYLQKKQPKKAIPYLAESYLIDRTLNNLKDAIRVTSNLCDAYTDLNKMDSALFYLEKGLSYVPQNPDALEVAELYETAAAFYTKSGDRGKADYYRNLQRKLEDSSKKLESNKETNFLALEFENKHKKDQLALLKKENEIKDLLLREQELTIERRNTLIIAIVVSIAFLLLSGILAYLAFRLKQKNKLFELSNKAKSSILHQVNHEIRTPLNGIVGMSQMALESKTFSELKEYLNHIRLSSDELLLVLNNLVTYLQLERREADPVYAPFNLIEGLEELFKLNHASCKQKGLLFNQMVYPGVPVKINADKHKVFTILQNLLSNAIRYTPKGVIKVEVKESAKRVKGNTRLSTLQFSIIDEGPGMSEKEIKKLFNYNPEAKSKNGFGIGLHNVKNLSEILNGHIEVISEKGTGSSFIFELEVEVLDNPLETINPGNRNQLYDPSIHKILVVEDNELNQRLFIKILEKEGYQFTAVNNGLRALSALKDDTFDLIIMDIRMPEMDGIEASYHIRNKEEFAMDKNIPIIVVTAHDEANERKKCLEIGVNDYLTKPVNKDLLLQKIKEQIQSGRSLK